MTTKDRLSELVEAGRMPSPDDAEAVVKHVLCRATGAATRGERSVVVMRVGPEDYEGDLAGNTHLVVSHDVRLLKGVVAKVRDLLASPENGFSPKIGLQNQYNLRDGRIETDYYYYMFIEW